MNNVKLNMIPEDLCPIIHVSQYDKGRKIRLHLFENKTNYVLDGTEVLSIIVKKPDNNIVSLDIANVFEGKSYVDFFTTEQMCACVGEAYGEFTISKNGTSVSSKNFVFLVEGAPDEGGVTSQSEINNLARQVHDIVVEELEDNGAEETGYDNTESGLEATNVQDAIDELADRPSVDAYTKQESDEKYAAKSEVIPNNKTDTSLFVGSGSGDNNTESGGDNGKYNTTLGVEALKYNTTGNHNTAVGFQAMNLNLSGNANTVVGQNALFSNVSGIGNCVVGAHALQNSTSNGNVGVGQSALQSQTTGYFNTALGNEAGKGAGTPITTDDRLTLIGNKAGKNTANILTNSTAIGSGAMVSKSNQVVLGNSNVTELLLGTRNITSELDGMPPDVKTETSLFIGENAGARNTESGGDNGKYNTAVGVNAMWYNTEGDHNTAVGFQAMQYNTTGDGNTAFGEDALYSNVSGTGNTVVGAHAMQNSTSNGNVAVGQSALLSQTSGYFNTAVGNEAGKGAGQAITTDDRLTLIGNKAGKNVATILSNSTAVGSGAMVSKSNQVVLGNGSVTELVVGNYVLKFNPDSSVTWEARS